MKTTEEKNRMIAEFMGNKPFGKDRLGSYLYNNPMNEIKFSHKNPVDMTSHDFEYHTSWDWLMPVVEKIEGMGYSALIQKNRCITTKTNYPFNGLEPFIDVCFPSKIEATYEAVVQFIEWYNENKQP